MKRVEIAFFADESGAVAVLAAIGMLVFFGCAALALDIAHLQSVKRELAKAAEAGALAGARGLWPRLLPSTSSSRSPDCAAAQTWALHAATSNRADGANLVASEVAVVVGHWDYATKTFTPGSNSTANGVQVTTHRDNVLTLFAKLIGVDSMNISATATAVMDFANAVGHGTLPIAINKPFTGPGNLIFINFTPDPLDNGGWFADPPDNASAKTFKNYIDNAACPPLNVGDIISLQNGGDTSCLQDLAAKVTQCGGTMDTLLPVVDTDKFNQSEPIVGFVPFRITKVNSEGNNMGVNGTVISLTEMASALPGGANYGGLAPPKLVQ